MNAHPRRTYTRRQPTVPLEACLTRQALPAAPTDIPVATRREPVKPRRPVVIWGVRGSLLLAAAVGGMGTGAGVMALLMPTPRPASPVVSAKIMPTVQAITPRPEVLIAPADTRPIVAAVLRKGGRPDPFTPLVTPLLASVQPSDQSPVIQAQAPVLGDLPAPPSFVAANRSTAATRILPPPAVMRQILPPMQSLPVGTLPVPVPLEAPPAVVPGSTLPAAEVTESPITVPTQPFVMTPVSEMPAPVAPIPATIPTPPPAIAALAAVSEGNAFTLIGTAIAGDNRIALIRTGTGTAPLAVSMGDTVAGWRIQSIDENHVVLTQGSGQQTLKVGS